MDYRVRRDPTTLESTGFMEIYPGPDSGAHWQPGGLFVWEDAFWVAEGVLVRHHSAYDHLSPNEIPKSAGVRIINDWRAGAEAIRAGNIDAALAVLDASKFTWIDAKIEFTTHGDAISLMLEQLADECARFYQGHDLISVLGV